MKENQTTPVVCGRSTVGHPKTAKRLLALLLTFCMLATTLCMPAFAVDSTNSEPVADQTGEEVEAVAEVSEGETVTEIETADQFLAINGTGNYALTADITLNLTEPLDFDFTGVLDGKGNTLTVSIADRTHDNGTPDDTSDDYTYHIAASGGALFDTLSGTVQNLNLNVGKKDAPVTLNYSGETEVCYGVIAKEVTGSATLTNVHVWAYVNYTNCTGVVSIGGFFGSVNPSAESEITIEECSMNGEMTHTPTTALAVVHQVGGFIGLVQSENVCTVKFDSCENNAKITDNSKATQDPGIGGFIGRSTNANATIEMTDCVNTGGVTATLDKNYYSFNGAGGFMGLVSAALNLTMNSCVNRGNVSSKNYTGGLVGLVDSVETLTVKNCVNYATVNGAQVGGLIGRKMTSTTASVSHCVNYGAITSTTRVGGIVGVGPDIIFNYCVNAGTVTTSYSKDFAGVICFTNSTLNNCVTFSLAVYKSNAEEKTPQSGCTLIEVTNGNLDEVKAAVGQAYISVSQTNKGAGVRIVNDDKGTGLRFKFTMDEASMTALQTLATTLGEEGTVEVGAIFLPADMIEEGKALTKANYDKALLTEEGGSISEIKSDADGNYYYYASLVNIQLGHYNDTYSCQSFFRFRTSADGDWITVYGDNMKSESVQTIATKALNDPNQPDYSDDQLNLLEQYSAAANG